MDLSILVNSCDLYEDAWYPFFKLLKIQWSDCPYEMFLHTENKCFECEEFKNVKSILSGGASWSDGVLNALDQIDSEYILFFLEDQFLREKVNVEWFNKSLEHIKNDDSIGMIILRHTEKQTKEFKEDWFPRSEVTDKFLISAMAAIYRKEYFKLLLKKGENPWEFETNASVRAKELPYKVLQYNNSRPPIFVYDDKVEKGYGISGRKWMPKNKELFEKYGIEVNFDNLGIFEYSSIEEMEKDLLKKRRKELSLKEKLYLAKKKIFK